MKQRYHYNVANSRVEQHIKKGNDDGLFVSSVSSGKELWALIMGRWDWVFRTDVEFEHAVLTERVDFGAMG